MFNFFKKKKRVLGYGTNPKLSEFKKTLVEEKKAAMMYSMLMVLAADKENFNIKMDNYFHNQAGLLGFDLGNNSMMEQYKSKTASEIYEILKELNTEQKKWYAISMYSSLYDLGYKPSKKQVSLYLSIGEQSENPYMR